MLAALGLARFAHNLGCGTIATGLVVCHITLNPSRVTIRTCQFGALPRSWVAIAVHAGLKMLSCRKIEGGSRLSV